MLAPIFNRAVLIGDVDVSPLKRVPEIKRPRVPKRDNALTVAQLERLADAASRCVLRPSLQRYETPSKAGALSSLCPLLRRDGRNLARFFRPYPRSGHDAGTFPLYAVAYKRGAVLLPVRRSVRVG